MTKRSAGKTLAYENDKKKARSVVKKFIPWCDDNADAVKATLIGLVGELQNRGVALPQLQSAKRLAKAEDEFFAFIYDAFVSPITIVGDDSSDSDESASAGGTKGRALSESSTESSVSETSDESLDSDVLESDDPSSFDGSSDEEDDDDSEQSGSDPSDPSGSSSESEEVVVLVSSDEDTSEGDE